MSSCDPEMRKRPSCSNASGGKLSSYNAQERAGFGWRRRLTMLFDIFAGLLYDGRDHRRVPKEPTVLPCRLLLHRQPGMRLLRRLSAETHLRLRRQSGWQELLQYRTHLLTSVIPMCFVIFPHFWVCLTALLKFLASSTKIADRPR